MELTISKIDELNKSMLGLGEPTERDDIGYNKPDFSRMESIGRLNVNLSFIEAYAVLQTLIHYKNTQLLEIKDDLEETLATYKIEFKKRFGNKNESAFFYNAIYSKEHSKEDYIKRTLIYNGNNNGLFFIAFREKITNDGVRKFGKWTKLSNGDWCLSIPFDKVNSFLDYVRNIGKYGYVAPKELLEDLQTYEKESVSICDKPLYFSSLNKKNSYGYDLYEINTISNDLIQELWNLKGRGIVFINNNSSTNTIVVSTNDEMLPCLLSFLKGKRINVEEVERQYLIRLEAQENINKSNYKLIDISSLELPFEPYPFQIEDAKEIISKKKALIGHDMGCGKTFISVLIGMSIPEKKLVVCPETLRLNWEREIKQIDRKADVKIVYSNDKEVSFGKNWTITGYKTAVKFEELILSNGFNCLFIDEAHKCKAVNSYGKPSSQQAKTIMNLSNKAEYVYLLTGTPMPTQNKDLYNELVMLGEIDDSEKYSFHKFGLKYCDGHRNDFGWDYNGTSNSNELHNILCKYMTRRLKSEVLPNLTKQRIPILIETPLSKDYRNIEKRLYDMEEDDTYMGLAMTGRRYLSKCKISSAIELTETICECGESVVIVAEFDETLDALLEHFGDDACCIRGGMSDKKKQQAIDDFQSGAKKVCCINLIAAGVGITLTKAHNMVVCDYDWTPSNMTQVEDRICRAGQNNHCNIYYLCHNKAILDEIFIEMISEKSANIDRVIDNSDNTVDLASLYENEATKNRKDDYISRLKQKIIENGGSLPKPKSKKRRSKKNTVQDQ